MILSILIPTVKGREQAFNELKEFLQWQISRDSLQDKVEILSLCDNKEISIGEKRNRMLQMANGEYCVMIDDDDTVHYNYVPTVLKALESKPDCIGYKELCLFENDIVRTSDFSIKYPGWEDSYTSLIYGGFNHVRTPFYKAPIKTELCKQVGFKDLRFAEDHDFSKRIHPLLKNESYIDEFMYIYRYKTEPHNQKYGIR